MGSYGAGLHDRPSLTKEIKHSSWMLVGVCGQGKEFLERLSNGGDLQIRGDIEIEVSP